MSTRNTSYEQTLGALKRGAISVEEALQLARAQKHDAEFMVSTALLDYSLGGPDTLDSPKGRIVELAWRLFGPEKCLMQEFRLKAPSIVVRLFLQRELADAPEQFSDSHLEYVRHCWPNLESQVLQVQDKRVKAYAEHLQKQPAELNRDIERVQEYVSGYHFNPELNDLLNKVEGGLIAGGDAFDQAALLKHLRTFFEKLHEHVGKELRQRKPDTVDGTDLGSCGQAIDYLERKGVLTERMKALGRALYGVLSNEGVHAIKSAEEYVRLCRNMVAEYALVLFFELDRRLKA